eukprot:5172356-Pleurochrysis_carterae.AAC.1
MLFLQLGTRLRAVPSAPSARSFPSVSASCKMCLSRNGVWGNLLARWLTRHRARARKSARAPRARARASYVLIIIRSKSAGLMITSASKLATHINSASKIMYAIFARLFLRRLAVKSGYLVAPEAFSAQTHTHALYAYLFNPRKTEMHGQKKASICVRSSLPRVYCTFSEQAGAPAPHARRWLKAFPPPCTHALLPLLAQGVHTFAPSPSSAPPSAFLPKAAASLSGCRRTTFGGYGGGVLVSRVVH